jgi:hypothetical protein
VACIPVVHRVVVVAVVNSLFHLAPLGLVHLLRIPNLAGSPVLHVRLDHDGGGVAALFRNHLAFCYYFIKKDIPFEYCTCTKIFQSVDLKQLLVSNAMR